MKEISIDYTSNYTSRYSNNEDILKTNIDFMDNYLAQKLTENGFTYLGKYVKDSSYDFKYSFKIPGIDKYCLIIQNLGLGIALSSDVETNNYICRDDIPYSPTKTIVNDKNVWSYNTKLYLVECNKKPITLFFWETSNNGSITIDADNYGNKFIVYTTYDTRYLLFDSDKTLGDVYTKRIGANHIPDVAYIQKAIVLSGDYISGIANNIYYIDNQEISTNGYKKLIVIDGEKYR